MTNEFELQELNGIVGLLAKRLDSTREKLQSRIEDVENNFKPLDEPITELTKSDDIEAMKAKINQLIKELNRMFLSAD